MIEETIYNIKVWDENGKLKQEEEKTNLITNGYSTTKNEVLQNEINVASFDGVSDQNENFKPSLGGTGGIILLQNAQTENVNNLVPQGPVIGYAGDSTSTGDPRRGQRDDGLSGTVGSPTATGFKDVYNFAPGEATGSIDSVAKVSKDGGNGEILSSVGSAAVLNAATGYNQAYDDDMGTDIVSDDATGTQHQVPTNGEQKYEQAIFEGNYETSALTITGYTANRGITFYNGSYWTIARHTGSGEDRVVELDEDFTILNEFDTTLTLTLANFWSYSCGLLDDGVDINAVFISAIDEGADTMTFKVLNLTSGLITDTIVTDNMTLSSISASTRNTYNTFRDPLGNENLISLLNQSANATAKYMALFDNDKTVIEENICSDSGFIDGTTIAATVNVPHGGYENMVRLATAGSGTSVFQMRFARTMMSNNDITTVVKGALDSMQVTVQVNYV